MDLDTFHEYFKYYTTAELHILKNQLENEIKKRKEGIKNEKV